MHVLASFHYRALSTIRSNMIKLRMYRTAAPQADILVRAILELNVGLCASICAQKQCICNIIPYGWNTKTLTPVLIEWATATFRPLAQATKNVTDVQKFEDSHNDQKLFKFWVGIAPDWTKPFHGLPEKWEFFDIV